MAGQFPQSPDLASFWHNLKNGVDCVTEVSPQRWSTEQFYDPDPQAPGKTNCKWMGALPDADTFDPAFFNISPNEAVAMDPQQRKILETSWHCIEEAGINADGIFIGVAPGDYGMNADDDELSSHGPSSHDLMGRSMSILSARTAFFLNLKGPCITLDTACSSSLVAIAEACNNLTLGNCDVALAGGVNVNAQLACNDQQSRNALAGWSLLHLRQPRQRLCALRRRGYVAAENLVGSAAQRRHY